MDGSTVSSLPGGCLDENAFAAIFEGDAGAAVDAHVDGCDACRNLVATYARLFAEGSGGEPDATSVVGSPPALALALPLALPIPNATALARVWADAQIGKTVGDRWTLERIVGIGGSAIVFEGHHRTGSRVAIKLLRPEHVEHAALFGRFLREAYVANKVGHPGVVRVLDDGATDRGVPFLVMDLLAGETLRERVSRAGALSADEVVRVGRGILAVLSAAHEAGIVHRDLKPDNVFLEANGAVRVLDFGIARAHDAGRPASPALVADTDAERDLTQTGFGMGTSAYMPPEQARGDWDAVGPRSDLWALGATLLYALAARPPHVESNPQKTLFVAATTPAPKVASLAPDVPSWLARVLDRALAFARDDRFESAAAMDAALAEAEREHERAMPVPRARRPTRVALVAGGVAIVLLAGGAIALQAQRRAGDRVVVTADRGASGSAPVAVSVPTETIEGAPARPLPPVSSLAPASASATSRRTPPPITTRAHALTPASTSSPAAPPPSAAVVVAPVAGSAPGTAVPASSSGSGHLDRRH